MAFGMGFGCVADQGRISIACEERTPLSKQFRTTYVLSLIGFLVAAVLGCGDNGGDLPPLVVVSNPSGAGVGLAEDSWTTVQELNIDVAKPGHVQITAHGGEPVVTILPADDYRFTGLKTLIGIGPTSQFGPRTPGTFVVACCADGPYPYRVSAYSSSETYEITEPGTYSYALYARSPVEGDGETSVRPGTMTAVFIPD